MSIRIHELAKKIGMDNKQLLSLLKERHYDVKSVSSTIDNISAEALEEEFKGKFKPEGSPEEAPAPAAPAAPVAPAAAPRVKSLEEVQREREVAAQQKAAPTTPTAPPVPPRPASPAPAPAPAAAAPAAPVSAPRPLPPPPAPVSRPSAPPPLPQASAPRPVSPPPVTSAPFSAPRPVGAPLNPIRSVTAPPVAPVAPAASVTSAPMPVPSAPKPVSTPIAPPPLPPRASAPLPTPPMPASAPRPTPVLPGSTATVPPLPPLAPGELRVIHLKPPIVVRDFATALGLKPFKLISELMEMGIFASMNQNIDEAVAMKVGEKHGVMLEIKHRGDAASQQAAKEKEKEKKKPEEDEAKHLVIRPPVVCILGHVDHGKTSLLDAIRKANVAAGEAGGITQHIGAYQIEFNDRRITFLDTPGHAAFTKMRSRGASVTDVAVLVVAADDGFMPQTDEALKHAQNAKVSLIVAVNKMDVKGANIDQVKAQMQQRNIAPEDWGGEVITVPVSAIKGTGINDLLEMILLQTDVLELKANPKAEASGAVIESQVDVGRGPLATLLVQRGTLKVGDSLVCGANWCKVRAMFDDKGQNLKEAGPSTPVRVIGWSGTPDSGATFRAVKNAREAENLAEEEQQKLRKTATTTAAQPKEVSVESLFANIAATQQKVLKLIIKTDVFGSSEAVRHVLEGIKSSKVSVEIVSTDVGLVTKNDVLMASTGSAVIIGFSTKLENGVTPLAKHHGVRIETFDIIYELADKVREMMADMLDPELKEVKLGAAEVRATFPLAKGFVAGCLVTEGKVTRNASARVRRGKEVITEGKVATLKRFKDDANEVRAGLECGIKLDDYNGYQTGDIIECFEVQKVRASL
ncbi:translation initiation factor IF-2 [Nibricoccus sp. IMCC34717]|uniref:translation initiation factor IF-2 n=1 Tax=Nibricoccus sp. IMCC34717 TaxID=3034021 RepID=UPI00384F5DBB